jgi:hypothetical protein
MIDLRTGWVYTVRQVSSPQRSNLLEEARMMDAPQEFFDNTQTRPKNGNL